MTLKIDHFSEYRGLEKPKYTKDKYLKRENKDNHTIDEQGKLILDLCKSSALRILNGRTVGDKYGQFTRYPTRNLEDKPSVIDYAICSDPLLKEVISFTVLPFTGLSDHSCISLKIKTNVEVQKSPPYRDKNLNTKDKRPISRNKYIYDKERKHVYECALRNDTNINTLRSLFEQTNISAEEIDKGISQFNDILLNAAKKSSCVKRQNLKDFWRLQQLTKRSVVRLKNHTGNN